MSKVKNYLGNSFYVFIGKVITGFSGFVFVWLLNKILSPAQYGNYVLAMTIISIEILLIGGGFDKLILYRISGNDNEQETNQLMGKILFWELVFSSIIILFNLLMGEFFANAFDSEGLKTWIYAFSPIIYFNSVKSSYLAWLKSHHLIKENAIISQILFPLLKLFFVGIVYFISDSPFLISTAITCSILFSLINWIKSESFWNHFKFSMLKKENWKYSFNILFTRFINRNIKRMDILVIGFLLTQDMVAEYKIAWLLSTIIKYGDQILTQTFLPRISDYIKNKSLDHLTNELYKVRKMSLLFGLIITLGLILTGKQIILYIGDYNLAYNVMLVLVVGWLINITFTNVGNILQMAGKEKVLLYDQIFLFIFNLFGNYILIKQFGIIGGAIATVLSKTITNFIKAIQIEKYVEIKYSSLKINLLLLLSAGSILISLINDFYLIVSFVNLLIITGIFIYDLRKVLQNIGRDLIENKFNR